MTWRIRRLVEPPLGPTVRLTEESSGFATFQAGPKASLGKPLIADGVSAGGRHRVQDKRFRSHILAYFRTATVVPCWVRIFQRATSCSTDS